jgi:hypothetical protein
MEIAGASEEDTEDHTAKSSVISNDLIAKPRSPRVSVNVANDATHRRFKEQEYRMIITDYGKSRLII